jgi:SynChlorMet cassette protein ScmC
MLELFDLKYRFKGTDKTKDFVSALNNIMMLRENGKYSNFIILRKGLEDFLTYYPTNNLKWKIYDNSKVKCAFHPILKDIICELGNKESDYFKAKYMFFPLWLQIVEAGGLIAHSSLVVKDGRGILMCGSNSSGKSTCYKRFPEEFEKISDDWNIIFPCGRDYFVSPWPTWSHFLHKKDEKQRKWNVNRKIRLQSIFFLQKSQSTELKKPELGFFYQAFIEMHKELLHFDIKHLSVPDKRKFFSNIFENSWNLNRKVSSYSLKISLKEDFTELMKEVI